MTAAQAVYPLIAASEVAILVQSWMRRSRAQNAAVLRVWLIVQLVIFAFLEPTSFRAAPVLYAKIFLICTLFSSAADLTVLYSVFVSLEDGIRAFGSVRAWTTLSIMVAIVFCLAAELPLPAKITGTYAAWITVVQMYDYLRIVCLVALSLYGWLRASSWPRDLAWTWLAMALYSITESIVVRVQIIASNTLLLEWVTSTAALAQLAGFWRALSYSPKPLTQFELEAAEQLWSTYEGSE